MLEWRRTIRRAACSWGACASPRPSALRTTSPAATLEQEAEDALHEAVRLDPQLPEPHRELGLLAYRRGEYRAACREFRHYLDAAPDADDAQALARPARRSPAQRLVPGRAR